MLTHFIGKAAKQQEEEEQWSEKSRNLTQDILEENPEEDVEIVLSSSGFTDYYRFLLQKENMNITENSENLHESHVKN
jgi:hypothetical protein